MGDIYKGTDRQTGSPVAIKLLRKTASPQEQTRFGREIQILADLRHPNIVQYIDHGTWEDGRLFFAMEWLDGEDLSRRQRRAPLGMRDAVEVVRRSAAAMAAIHARGVVHRDLKLANIFLIHGKGTAIKLIDFGVVKAASPDEFPTERGAIIGTPHFMAPEQARGEQIDARADVYSLGSVLFRLVVGRNVFETEHIIALLGRLVLEDPPPPSSLRFDVPETLDKVILRSLSRDPGNRYENGGELARALARVGNLNNDPPATDRSASAIRKTSPERKAPITMTPTGADSRPKRPPAERRVIATVVYDLGGAALPTEVERSLRDVLGEDMRLESLLGEKLVAVLGVERSTGDEPLRAARAALTVTRGVPQARVVVAVGQAIRGRANLAGEALERAAGQLEAVAAGAVRVDRHAATALAGRFVIQEDEQGGVLVREDATGFGARLLLGRPTPTVGREKEVALLQGVYGELVDEGTPRAGIVIGPAGVGKSRVRSELLQRLEVAPQPPEVLMCRGDLMSRGSSISALGRALRQMMGIHDGEARMDQVHKVKRHLFARLPRALRFLAAFLGELIGVPFPDDADEPLRAARANSQLMQSRLRMALEAFIRSQAEHRPQLLIIEDMHWADDTTIDLCDWLLGCPDLRCGVLAFARPEISTRLPSLWERHNVTRLSLSPLSPLAADRLVAAALPKTAAQDRTEIVKRAGGNALFLEELIRCAAEGRDELPLTVQAVVQMRLDRLPASVREVVRAASVFGQSCWSGGVAALLERNVDDELKALLKHEILAPQPETRIHNQDEYMFRQALVRDAAYASILDEDRQVLHLAAGSWLETMGNADVGLVARHADAGGDFERASMLYARATRQAYSNGAELETALELAERGLACGASGGLRAQLLLAKAQVCAPMGRLTEAVQAAEEAASLSPAGSDMWAEAQRLSAAALIESGQSTDGDSRAAWALSKEFAEALSLTMRAQLLAVRVRGLVDLNMPHDALQVANEAVSVADQAGDSTSQLRALDAQLFALMHVGDPSEVVPRGESLIERADQAGDAVLATRARMNTASTLNLLGHYEDAEQMLERAKKDARSRRMRILEAFALHNQGMTEVRLGKLDSGIDKQREAARIADETRAARLRIHTRVYEAMFLVWRGGPGDLATASSLSDWLMTECQQLPTLLVTAHFTRARVLLARGEQAAALESASEAYRLLESGPVEEWEESIRLTYVDALDASGRHDEAKRVLERAFLRLVDRARSIRKREHRQTFLTRPAEVQRLVELARDRLGRQLPDFDTPVPPPPPRHG